MVNLIHVVLLSDVSQTSQNFLSNSFFLTFLLANTCSYINSKPDFGTVKVHCKNPTQIPYKAS